MHDNQLTTRRTVTAELVADSDRTVSGEALGRLATQLANSSGLANLLLAKEKREIARRLHGEHQKAAVDIAIKRLTAESNTRILDIELAADQQYTEILVDHNQRMGDLKLQNQSLVAKALKNVVTTEKRDQAELAQSDMLEEDRQMLSELYKQRAAVEMNSIAAEHGLSRQPRVVEETDVEE